MLVRNFVALLCSAETVLVKAYQHCPIVGYGGRRHPARGAVQELIDYVKNVADALAWLEMEAADLDIEAAMCIGLDYWWSYDHVKESVAKIAAMDGTATCKDLLSAAETILCAAFEECGLNRRN